MVTPHDEDAGSGNLFHECMAGHMVGMGMTGKQDLDVVHLETKRFDRFTNQGNGFLKTTIDQDMSFRSCKKITSQVVRAYIVDVSKLLDGQGRGGREVSDTPLSEG